MKKLACLLGLSMLLACGAGAADVPSTWAQDDVESAIRAGLVPEPLQSGYQSPVTRAEFCTLVVRILNDDSADIAGVSFSDTTDEAVLRLAALGVVKGKGEGRFEPDAPISRQEAAALLYRMTGKTGLPAAQTAQIIPHVWNDRNVLDQPGHLAFWAREAADFCYNTGVIAGVGEDCFDPEGAYTREQSVCTLLHLKQWADAGGTASKTADRRFLFRDMQTGKYGYKNAAGEIVIPAQFDGLTGYTEGFLGDTMRFQNGCAAVYQGEKQCAIDIDGNRIARDNAWDGWFNGVELYDNGYAAYYMEDTAGVMEMPSGRITGNEFWPSETCSNGFLKYVVKIG